MKLFHVTLNRILQEFTRKWHYHTAVLAADQESLLMELLMLTKNLYDRQNISKVEKIKNSDCLTTAFMACGLTHTARRGTSLGFLITEFFMHP